jgi:hypothetical protein
MEKEKNKTPDNKKEQQQQKDPAVQRGDAAIAASRIVNPEPEEIQKQKEEEDAERWRNEG